VSIFENSVLRRIFRRKREEVTGTWRKCIVWSFMTSIVRSFMICVMRNVMMCILRQMLFAYSGSFSWVAHMTFTVEERKAYVVVVRKSEGKGPLGTGWIILK